MKKYLQFLLALTIIIVTACTPKEEKIKDNIVDKQVKGSALEQITLVSPDNKKKKLPVEIADTPNERIQGLMFRKQLGKDKGMLFIFDEPQILSFWMKNTIIPLDIIFFDEEKGFVSSTTMQPCMEDPCPLYKSKMDAKYALEVSEGFIKENEITNGWRLEN